MTFIYVDFMTRNWRDRNFLYTRRVFYTVIALECASCWCVDVTPMQQYIVNIIKKFCRRRTLLLIYFLVLISPRASAGLRISLLGIGFQPSSCLEDWISVSQWRVFNDPNCITLPNNIQRKSQVNILPSRIDAYQLKKKEKRWVY